MEMYFMKIYFYILWFGNKFIEFWVFPRNINESKILRKLKTQSESRQFKSDYEKQTFVL